MTAGINWVPTQAWASCWMFCIYCALILTTTMQSSDILYPHLSDEAAEAYTS